MNDRTLLLAPHADDESLFAAYICQREHPLGICCFNQGRADEFTYACAALGCSSVTLGMPGDRDPRQIAEHLRVVYGDFAKVWAPALEEDGHEDHNLISDVATEVYGGRVHHYLTYAPRGQRSTWGEEVSDVPAWMVAGKLRALACYISQIADPATRPWFTSLLDMREWVA